MAKLNIDAKQAIAEIRNLISELDKIKKASAGATQATKDNFKSMENSISSLKGKVALLGNQINYLQGILKTQNSTINKNTAATKSNTKSTNSNAASKKKVSKATDAQTKSNQKLNLSITSLLKAGGVLELGRSFFELAQNVYSNIKTFDSLAFTLEKITKTTFNYENSQRFLLRITQAYGVELVTTTLRWSRFLAAAQNAGLALRDAENIFESMTKASSALGLKTDELTSVYLALEQMLSKGKITTEELRRQLGERLPGAMGIMAASMGVTIPVLDKMLKKGEVLSADVLPDFARAVERAYGIEQAERIETLVSKQNRLTASWQTFIKNMAEGDSVIKGVLGGLLDILDDIIASWDKVFRNTNQQMRIDISIKEDEFEKDLEKASARYIDMISEVNKQEIKLNIDEKRLNELAAVSTGDSLKDIKNQLDEIARIRATKDKEAVENSRRIAKEEIKGVYEEYKEAEAKFKEIQESLNKEQRAIKPAIGTNVLGGAQAPSQAKSPFDQADFDKAYSDLVQLTAKYNVFRKLVDESDVSIITDEETSKTQRRLRSIRNYFLETINEITQATLDSDKERAANETLNLSDRLDAVKNAAKKEIFIRRNSYAIIERDAKEKLESEIESINDSIERGTLAREKGVEQIKKLEEEKNGYLRLEAAKLANDLIEINNKAIEQSNDIQINVSTSNEEGVTSDFYNKQIIQAKKVYEESKKTAKDRKQLEREVADATIKAANDIIDIRIRQLEAEIDVLSRSKENNSEYIADLKRQINELRAQKKVEPPFDKEEWNEAIADLLDVIGEFTSAVGDIFDAQFARRIENINAEIVAEENKYDRLIALAEGDEEQQKTLQRNKENRIKKLEKERLKQEQKQAKARKKFAIAEVAISTAVAIMRAFSDTGPISGIVFAAIIAAIGAAQIAAIASQPIPKYKEGVTNLNKDQVAMINDGSYKEYIERNGRILSTNKKDAIVGLKKGDTVYKNYDDMVSRSNLFKIKNINSIRRANEDRLLDDVTNGIVNGFRKAKINNNIQIINSDQNKYRESLSMWN